MGTDMNSDHLGSSSSTPESLGKAAHTPGPWAVVSQSVNDGSYGVGPANSRMLVASVHNGPSLMQMLNGQEATLHMANARLIAAAPDLLEAAQLGLAFALVKWGNLDHGANEAFDRIRAAIDKATT